MQGRVQLIDQLRRWAGRAEAIPYHEILAALRALQLERREVEETLVFDDRGYRRIVIGRSPHFEALLLCWKSGQLSPIHDHRGSACAVRVIAGRATETQFQRGPNGRLIPWQTRTFDAGSVLGCPDSGVHQMGNVETPDCDLITLHVYSPPPRSWQFYSLDQTTLAGHDSLAASRPQTIVVDLSASEPANPLPPEALVGAVAPLSNDNLPAVAIIGAGFSGTLVAVQLAALARSAALRIALFEKRETFGRGLAYGTRCDHHLLNVPAGLMSALPDKPGHFLDWLRTRDPYAQHGTFAPRRLYGDYLEDLLTSVPPRSHVALDRIRDEVVDVEAIDADGPLWLTTRSGRSLRADRVVLALGHQSPQEPVAADVPLPAGAYLSDPWDPDALADLAPDDGLFLIGTGLSAVDLVVEACATGHRGRIHAVSRHGMLPSSHASTPVAPRPHFVVPEAPSALTARGLFRRVRTEAAVCEREGGNWRSVVDALRPVTQTLWGALGAHERQRFVRHVAPRWDVHRHRVAPAIDGVIRAAQDQGRLVVAAGRVLALEPHHGGVAVTWRRRGDDGPETTVVRRVVNCTGPARDIRSTPSPILQAVLSRGLGRPGPLALGLDVNDRGALVAADGRVEERLVAIGPLLKERLWESTAVRELRGQAADLARALVDDLRV